MLIFIIMGSIIFLFVLLAIYSCFIISGMESRKEEEFERLIEEKK